MAVKKPFWKQPNVVGGLVVAIFGGLFLPFSMAAFSPLAFAEVKSLFFITYGEFSAPIWTFAGLVWLLWPKIVEGVKLWKG